MNHFNFLATFLLTFHAASNLHIIQHFSVNICILIIYDIIISIWLSTFERSLTVFYLTTTEIEITISVLGYYLALIFSISSFHYFSLSHCNVLMYMLQQTIGFMYDIYFSVFFNKFVDPGRAVPARDLWVVTRGKIFLLLLVSRHSVAKISASLFFSFSILAVKVDRSF